MGDVREWRLTDPPRPTFYQVNSRGQYLWIVARAGARPRQVAESLRAAPTVSFGITTSNGS